MTKFPKMTTEDKKLSDIEKNKTTAYYAKKYRSTHDEFYYSLTTFFDMNGLVRGYECEVGCKKIDIHNRVVFTSDLHVRDWKAAGDALEQLGNYLEGCEE